MVRTTIVVVVDPAGELGLGAPSHPLVCSRSTRLKYAECRLIRERCSLNEIPDCDSSSEIATTIEPSSNQYVGCGLHLSGVDMMVVSEADQAVAAFGQPSLTRLI